MKQCDLTAAGGGMLPPPLGAMGMMPVPSGPLQEQGPRQQAAVAKSKQQQQPKKVKDSLRLLKP